MTPKEHIKASKFLSLVLRHKPETIGLVLDEQGWADCQQLLEKSKQHGLDLSLLGLKNIVETNNKKRFAFSLDGSKIRANQGHSLKVELGLKSKRPPEFLFHGTAERNIESIKQKGILKGQRHHVHLSSDRETARSVGQRYGKPVVLQVMSKTMHDQAIEFYQSENGVWLTEFVDSSFVKFDSEQTQFND